MNIFKRIYMNLTHGYRVKRSWFAPYTDMPFTPEVFNVISPVRFKSPLDMTDEEAVISLLHTYGPRRALPTGPITDGVEVSVTRPEFYRLAPPK